MLAELGEVAVDERPRCRRHDDLPAVARSGDSRGAVELATGVALAGQLQLGGVKPDPHLDLAGRERLLTLRPSSHRLDRIGEDVEEGIPLRVDLDTAMGSEGGAQKTAVFRQCLDVAGLAELIDQLG